MATGRLTYRVSKDAPLSLCDQLVAQVELSLLAGHVVEGQRLPSVRGLARRLGVHPRTVHAAYRRLARGGLLELRHGSGAYARRGLAADGAGDDPVDRLAETLRLALRSGVPPADLRAALRRELEEQPAAQVCVVDPSAATAQLLACEVRERLGVPASFCVLSARPLVLRPGGLLAALPVHLSQARALANVPVASLCVEVPGVELQRVRELPAGSILLVVSRAPRVLAYAEAVARGSRGSQLVVECRRLEDRADWQALLTVADCVMADVSAWPAVRALRPDTRRLELLTLRSLADLAGHLALSTVGVSATFQRPVRRAG